MPSPANAAAAAPGPSLDFCEVDPICAARSFAPSKSLSTWSPGGPHAQSSSEGRTVPADGPREPPARPPSAVNAGVHPKAVSERLGHSSVAFTMDTYSSVIPSMGRAAADAADLLFGEEGGLERAE
jgi:hypothetical protein